MTDGADRANRRPISVLADTSVQPKLIYSMSSEDDTDWHLLLFKKVDADEKRIRHFHPRMTMQAPKALDTTVSILILVSGNSCSPYGWPFIDNVAESHLHYLMRNTTFHMNRFSYF